VLQFTNGPQIGQQATTDQFPPFGEQQPAGGACTLGPSNQATGVVINVYNALVDLQLFFRDSGSPQGYSPANVLAGFAPQSQVFPKAVGFVARSHVPGTPAAINAQVWEVQDGPLPQVAIPILGFLSPTGTITNGNMITGFVEADGTIAAGTGFTVNHVANSGLYQIVFDAPSPFTALPACSVLPLDTNRVASLNTGNGASVTFALTTLAPALVDEAFLFTCQAMQ
jgi:hypothetical protein